MHDFAIQKTHQLNVPINGLKLSGVLFIPATTNGLIIFVHGSGSSRLSPRNQFIAERMQQAKFATFLFDLLTADEDLIDEQTSEYRFNIDLLTTRLLATTHWLMSFPQLAALKKGYFGASTGGASALLAAAKDTTMIDAIVSRGGRPDLAGKALSNVKAATLLIVGGNDPLVIELNETALQQLTCPKKMTIVPGASHLFSEAGKLEQVADIALQWFQQYLGK